MIETAPVMTNRTAPRPITTVAATWDGGLELAIDVAAATNTTKSPPARPRHMFSGRIISQPRSCMNDRLRIVAANVRLPRCPCQERSHGALAAR